MYINNINLFKALFIIIIFLSGFFILLNPISASEIHIFPGDNIVTKIGSAVSGDTVYIHAGSYQISSSIIIPQNNIKIIGDGPDSTIITALGNFTVFSGNNRDYILLENIAISNITRIAVNLRDYAEINNCIIQNGSREGIIIRNYGKIKNSNIINTSNQAVTMGNNCLADNIFVKGTNIYHSAFVGGNDCNVSHSIVSGGNWDGIRLGNNAYVFNCLAYNNGDNGIQVGSNSRVYSSTSVNNGLKSDAQDRAGIVSRPQGGVLTGDLTVKDCIVANNPSNSYGGGVGGIIASSGTISYTNIYNSNGTPNNITLGPGVIYQDPLFMDGINSFYLSISSPCVNKGSDTSKNIGLYEGFTTRSDQYWDILTVDMGFHYTSGEGPLVENKNKPMDQIIRILNLNNPKNIGEIVEDCEANPDAEGCKPSQ